MRFETYRVGTLLQAVPKTLGSRQAVGRRTPCEEDGSQNPTTCQQLLSQFDAAAVIELDVEYPYDEVAWQAVRLGDGVDGHYGKPDAPQEASSDAGDEAIILDKEDGWWLRPRS